MAGTAKTSLYVPSSALADARERWPVTRDMSDGRLLRFALALALGKPESEALAATRDARIVTRTTQTTQ